MICEPRAEYARTIPGKRNSIIDIGAMRIGKAYAGRRSSADCCIGTVEGFHLIRRSIFQQVLGVLQTGNELVVGYLVSLPRVIRVFGIVLDTARTWYPGLTSAGTRCAGLAVRPKPKGTKTRGKARRNASPVEFPERMTTLLADDDKDRARSRIRLIDVNREFALPFFEVRDDPRVPGYIEIDIRPVRPIYATNATFPIIELISGRTGHRCI